MNILIPDSWLREFLETKATPEKIKECLSLCGPSIERVYEDKEETIYNVEVTTNRPDSMSVFGVAREAAAILPRFGIKAELKNDPYKALKQGSTLNKVDPSTKFKLNIFADPQLCPRWTSIVLDHVKVKESPSWMRTRLEQTGIRPLNNIIDITNYLMRAFGQPAHAFDFEEIKPDQNGLPTMILRSAKKGERITTLDGTHHQLLEGDIVIEDGSGRLIDLCGIMGAKNSSIRDTTASIVLCMQTYDPVHIRKTMMRLSHRTEAGSLFEKGPDAELVLPTVLEGIKLVEELAGGKATSELYDIYPSPYKPAQVAVIQEKVTAYLGKKLGESEIKTILTPLGLHASFSEKQITVTVPSFRRDIAIDVDIIEEIARLYGYHHIEATLPDTRPPMTLPDKALQWEEDIKIRLRDWGYTELYTYSMISEELMDIFGLDTNKAYKIANPLSKEWVYMRPTLTPSVLSAFKENRYLKNELTLFELSKIYKYRPTELPLEESSLVVVWKGDLFLEAKGLAESLFDLLGIPFPSAQEEKSRHVMWYTEKHLVLGKFGALGIVDPAILSKMGIKETVTRLYLDVSLLVEHANNITRYTPVPKYPPVIEDMSFTLPARTPAGEVVSYIKSLSTLISSVQIISQYENVTTFKINYLNREKPLLDIEVHQVRSAVKEKVELAFGAKLNA